MSDSEQEYDPSASAASPVQIGESTSPTSAAVAAPAASEEKDLEPANNQSEAQMAVEEQSDKSDAESEYNPEVPEPSEAPPKEEIDGKEEGEDDEEDDYDPEAGLSTEASPIASANAVVATPEVSVKSPGAQLESQQVPAPPSTASENDHPLSKSEKIQQFNSIITHFMSTPYLNDPTFQSLTPDQKSMVVLADYNKAKGTDIKTPINFHATTSFNKQFMKRNETAFPMVPVNPFCKRPDINSPKSYEFQQDYNGFIAEETKWARTGRVETLPSGSRLFIGNLPVNTITKEDCYRLFRPYGEIVQISIKPGYGFVQFASAEGCNDALEGETNVPLHGKMLQLEISKTQIRQAQEYQEKQRRHGGSVSADSSSGRETGPYSRRGRSRSPSPGRDNYKRRSSPPRKVSSENASECHIFQLPEASPMFVRKVLKILRKEGISFKIDQNIDDVESAGNDAAYAGAMAVVVVNADDLNVKTFEKTEDGGIKFDEYTNISVEEADSILSASKSRRGGSPALYNNNQNGANFDQKEYYKTNRGGNTNNRQRGDSRDNRGRGNQRGGQQRGRGGYDSRGGYQNHNGNNQYGSEYQNYQQPPMQQPPVQQGSPALDPAAIYAQLQNYDPNTIQQVLSLLGNQQQQQQQQSPPVPNQQPYGGYQPPQQQYGGYSNGMPVPQQQQQYYQQPPPQQSQQQQYYQAPSQAQSPPQPAPPGASGGSSLLEALARLKKNS